MIKPIKDICAIIDGHLTVFKHLFKKAVTLEYPEKKREINEKFRGKLEVKLDENGCVGCGICVKTCQFGAITVENNVAYIDYTKCKLCRKCEGECPTGAIVSVNFPPRKPAAEAPAKPAAQPAPANNSTVNNENTTNNA